MMDIKYEYSNGTHFVQIKCNDTIRTVYFPSNSLAIDFMHRMEGYAKLKTLEQIELAKDDVV